MSTGNPDSSKKIDLASPPPGHTFTASIEPRETPEERYVRLFKDVALFLVALVFVVAIGWVSFRTLSSSAASPDEKRWAQSALTGVLGGLVGCLVRK